MLPLCSFRILGRSHIARHLRICPCSFTQRLSARETHNQPTRTLLRPPVPVSWCWIRPFSMLSPGRFISVGLSGLEPLTPALSAQCSNLLSYRPFYLSHAPTHNLIRYQCCHLCFTFASDAASRLVCQMSRGALTPRARTQRFASPPLTPIRLYSLKRPLDLLARFVCTHPASTSNSRPQQQKPMSNGTLTAEEW
jgi:hypothetical protein